MPEPYLTYQKFATQGDAAMLIQLLEDNAIAFTFEDYSLAFDPSFANNAQSNEFRIKLKKKDFEIVDQIQLDSYADAINTVEDDYYLFSFTEKELLEILVKSDEWSKFDVVLAQKILRNRGKAVSENLIQSLRQQRLEELAQPEESGSAWVYAGYIFAFMGAFLGVFIGLHLFTHKKTLPNGAVVFGHSPADRKHGIRILVISVSFIIIWAVVKII